MLDDPYAMVPLPKVREMVRQAREEAAAEERAACAKVAELWTQPDAQGTGEFRAKCIAAAIRARGG